MQVRVSRICTRAQMDKRKQVLIDFCQSNWRRSRIGSDKRIQHLEGQQGVQTWALIELAGHKAVRTMMAIRWKCETFSGSLLTTSAKSNSLDQAVSTRSCKGRSKWMIKWLSHAKVYKNIGNRTWISRLYQLRITRVALPNFYLNTRIRKRIRLPQLQK